MNDKELLVKVYNEVIEQQAELSELSEYDITLLLKLCNRVKKYRKSLTESGTLTANNNTLKIAVLGSYSIQHFVSMLDTFLYGCKIEAEIYEGEYDGIKMDVLDSGSDFYKFNPQIVLLLMDDRDIKVSPACFEEENVVDELVLSQYEQISMLWESIHNKLESCQILQTNIVIPPLRQLGNLEAGYSFSRSQYIGRINNRMACYHPSYVTIMDMEYLASYVGKKNWFDYQSYFLTKAGYSPDCLGSVAGLFARQIMAIKGKAYKCLVLDLDNTLWGGVVGDDGYDGIQLDPHNAVGEAYRSFQRYILALKERGVILAVCSKNEESIAKEPFEKNQDMILKLSDIACFVANWEDKAGNIRRIATELNIGIDSLVFVDDNPAEREIVKNYVPEVMVINLPEDPACYSTAIEESGVFTWAQITKEDITRSQSYVANRERAKLSESFVDYDEYLKALDMRAHAGEPDGSQLARFTQLINKSNQFNLRTQRYTEAEILAMKQEPEYKLIYIDLKDKFSEYGIISCIILKKMEDTCFIDTWLMSCRVLKRGVEHLAYNKVAETAIEWGCKKIIGEYIPTKKNMMVKEFYRNLGFTEESENIYSLSLSNYESKSVMIELQN